MSSLSDIHESVSSLKQRAMDIQSELEPTPVKVKLTAYERVKKIEPTPTEECAKFQPGVLVLDVSSLKKRAIDIQTELEKDSSTPTRPWWKFW